MKQNKRIRPRHTCRAPACFLLAAFLLSLSLFLSSCTGGNGAKKSKTLYGYFDTAVTLSSYKSVSEAKFEALCGGAEELLAFYHRESDIYHEYSGIHNLCTLNRSAGGAPLEISQELFELLSFCKTAYSLTNGSVNVMLGSVLSLWHDLREEGERLPTEEELTARGAHTAIESLVLDEEHRTAQITDPQASIDVGAIAKGYACQKVREYLLEEGADSFVLDVGGNLSVLGCKPNGKAFTAGIKNPDTAAAEQRPYVYTVDLASTSLSTTGGYERYYTVDGVRYHHCIDPDTLFPADRYDSVSVKCDNSAVSDTLSTALFLVSEEEGVQILQKAKDNFHLLEISAIYIVNGEAKEVSV